MIIPEGEGLKSPPVFVKVSLIREHNSNLVGTMKTHYMTVSMYEAKYFQHTLHASHSLQLVYALE